MDTFCGCGFYTDSNGALTQLVPFTYMLISGSFFAILFNFNIPPLKKYKWFISIPLSIPLALFSNLFFPLVAVASPPWVFIELLLFSPIGAVYSGFTYEHSLHFATRRLWSWRAEFGSESYWAGELGRRVTSRGADALWPDLTAP